MSIQDPLAIIGLLFALVFLVWLIFVSKSNDNSYSLSDLVSTKGHMDLSKIGQLICMLTTTWIVIHMELKLAAGIPEWALGLYMLAWVGAGFGSLYARIRGAPEGTTETTTATSVRTETTTPKKEGA